MTLAHASPLFGGFDTDGDGVRDRLDACVRIPETRNGYLDEDGCPDVLSGVTVGGSIGAGVEDGAFVMVKADGQSASGKGTVRLDNLRPGSEALVASMLGCLAGEERFTVGERHRKVRLSLRPSLFQNVGFLVRDALGQTVPTALVEVVSSEPAGCGLDKPAELLGGYGQLSLGRGSHVLKVTTPDGAKFTTTVKVGSVNPDVMIDMPPPGGTDARGRLLADTVYFGDNDDSLDPSAEAIVQRVASYLKSNPKLGNVTVEGHADHRAWGPYNRDLSERRAASVVEALVRNGVDASRLKISAQGEKVPAETGSGADVLAKNRRVHFIVAK